MEKKTALYEEHVAAGGKMVPFAGYLLPVEYAAGLVKEHTAVRSTCGLFDVSHMGEVFFSGEGAVETLNALMTNEISTMPVGGCRYSPMCNAQGGTVDDVIVYRLGEESFLVVVNAANREKDVAWMKANRGEATHVEDRSDAYGQLALHGPLAAEVLAKLADPAGLPARSYTFTDQVDVDGVSCLVSRTGYTGEDGFELYFAAEKAPLLWNALLAAGEPQGILPCGLGARDTLRFEASMPLYGHEMDETITPLEAGLGFAVKMGKASFIGKEALEGEPPARTRVGLEVTGRGIIREHAPVTFEGRVIGATTSGTYCPTLSKACAMALVEAGSVALGDEVSAEVRGREVAARVVKMPFYQRNKD